VQLHYREPRAEDGAVTELERVLTLGGEINDEQRQLLLGVADKCPMHRTLTGKI